MSVVGRVREWNDDEGWGVVDAPAVTGGCWTHFSAVAVPGFRSLEVGQEVELEWEAARQDGYDHRAVRVWPVGHEPLDDPPPVEGPTSAYDSSSTIVFDSGEDPPR